MNNQLRAKTRLAFIQVIFQHISTNNDIDEILNSFEVNYKSTFVENFNDKKKIKFEFNSNFLKKLIIFYSHYIKDINYSLSINKFIKFDRKFEKWDKINQSIFLASISELYNTKTDKIKITFNDYLNISKYFINPSEIAVINAILDKVINDKK